MAGTFDGWRRSTPGVKNHAPGCGAMYCPHEADPLSTSAFEVGGDPMHSDPRAQSNDDQADLRARGHNVGRTLEHRPRDAVIPPGADERDRLHQCRILVVDD